MTGDHSLDEVAEAEARAAIPWSGDFATVTRNEVRFFGPELRADYVVERLSNAVPGPSEQDWGQIRRELAWAYKEIDDAQRGNRVRTTWGRGFGFLLVYAIIAMIQWQLDTRWAAVGLSLRVVYLPIVMIVAVPLVLQLPLALWDMTGGYFHRSAWVRLSVPSLDFA